MNITALQRRIDTARKPEEMIAIAEDYLDGTVLRDGVAAEAWLTKAIETADPLAAPKAMGLLARRVLKKREILTDEDYLDIRRRAQTAEDGARQELLALLELGTDRQKSL